MTRTTHLTAIRILFVEDHRALRNGTRPLLNAAPGLEVVGECADAAEAVALAQQLRPDVVLLDLFLARESSGLDAARQILRTVPSTAILVLTGAADPEYARRALQLGIRGYLLKTASMEEIIAAIRQVRAGGVVLDPTLAPSLIGARASATAGALTQREQDVLRLLGQGKTNADIAKTLLIAVRTVDWHLEQLKKKLELPSRGALVAHAAHARQDAVEGRRLL